MQARFLPAAAIAFFISVGAAAAAEIATPAVAVEPGETAGPHLLAEVESGRVVAHHDALRPWFPASTTKLMTTYVVFRAIAAGQITMESPVTVSSYAARQPPSEMGFGVGTVLTLDNALKMMLVKSANDLAVAVAESVGGTEENFAARMNDEARRIGMTRSHFVNPHGLPDARQYTTARDMAVLARALLREFPQYRRFFNIHAIQLYDEVFDTFNPLIERFPGATGMKTGFICASGYNLVGSAKRGNREFVAVVFGSHGGRERAEEAAALLDEGFRSVGPPGRPSVTLANVSSGGGFSQPYDMREEICGPQRPAASEANTDGGSETERVSHLGLPMYLGPPIQVFVELSGEGVHPGEPGFVARVPRPRPDMGAALTAFAPTDEGDSAPPTQAIGSAVGAPSPLSGVSPD